MKNLLICMLILINIIIVFFIPIVPGVFIGGMQPNGYPYTEDIHSTILDVFVERNSTLADAIYSFDYKILIIELILLIIIDILYLYVIKKVNKKIEVNNK